MTNEENHFQEKKYYSISEVATFLHVKPSLIRYWESIFPQLNPRKNKKGTRLFTPKDIEYLKYIRFLVKEKGHTLKAAKKILRQSNSQEAHQFKIKSTLESMKGFLEELKEAINYNKNSG